MGQGDYNPGHKVQVLFATGKTKLAIQLAKRLKERS